MSRTGPSAPEDPPEPRSMVPRFPSAPFTPYHPWLPSTDDPLIFDLAGTGLNFTPLAGSRTFFAYSPGQAAVQTGWMTAGEGMLVIDRHPASLQVTADEVLGAQSGNGLADLAALDANHDGIIDAQDPGFAQLKIWIDANGDGITDPGELVSLTDAGIASIQLAAQPGQSTDVINGTRITSTFGFTRTNGATGHAAEVLLPVNHVYTVYIADNGFQFVPDAFNLPFLIGYGNVPSLSVAISLRPDLLAEVKNLVLTASSMSGRAFDAAFQQMLADWAGVGTVDPASRGQYNNARHMGVVEAFYGQTWAQASGTTTEPVSRASREFEATYQSILDELKIRFAAQVSLSQLALGMDAATVAGSAMHIYDAVVFDPLADRVSVNFTDLVRSIIDHAPAGAGKLAWYDQTLPMLHSLRVDLFAENATDFGNAFTTAATAAGCNAAVQRLANVEFSRPSTLYSSDGPALAGTGQNDLMLISEGGHSFSGLVGADTYVYEKAATGATVIFDNAAFSTGDQLLLVDVASTGIAMSRNGPGDDLVLTVLATGATITLQGQFSGVGLGTIETLVFADSVIWSDADIKSRMLALETAGTGTIYGFNASNDVLNAGTGDRILNGLGGADTYVWSALSGNDTIDDGASASNLVMSGINSTDVTAVRNGTSDDLVLTDTLTGRQVTVKGQFSGYGWGTMASIGFADGVTWSAASLRQSLLDAATGAAAGSVYGFAGHNDVLVAGLGDKYLNGLGGADTYVYSALGGNDTIDDGASQSNLVMSGINSTDVVLSRLGPSDDLVLTDTLTGKSVTVKGEFSAYGQGILASIGFADGVHWDAATVRQKLLDAVSASGQGAIYGYGRVNDILVAGQGDRYLNGLGGQDTYVWSALSGNDTIDDGSSQSKLVMPDINSTGVTLTRHGTSDDAVLVNRVTGKSITIKGQFSSYAQGILQSIGFADGPVWSAADVRQKLLDAATASGQASIYGYGHVDDVLVAGSGDRYLNGLGGHDTYIYSGLGGNDTIDDGAALSTLVMSGIASNQVAMRRNGDDLLISLASTGKTLTVKGEFSQYGWGTMRLIQFADGVSFDLAAAIAATNNHAPTAIQATGASVARLAGTGTLVGRLTTSDIDAGDSHSYAIAGAASSLFALSGDRIVVRQGAVLKAAAGQTYLLNITSTDSGGLSVTQAVSIAVTAPGPRAAQATLIGAAGNNTLVGAARVNTVDYSASSTRVDINLSTGIGSHDGGNTDHLRNIQNLIGTDFGDTLLGTGGGNVFTLGRGANIVNGLGGRDSVDYSRAGTGVAVDLAGQFALHDGTRDSLIGLLNVNGSAFDDTLHGAAGGHSSLSGGAGNDALYGIGHDTLTGGAGADRFIFANAAAGHNVVTDFVSGTDMIALIEGGFGSLHAGDAVHLLSGHGTPAQIFGHQSTPAFAFDTDSGGLWFKSFAPHSSAVLVATLTGVTALNVADLVIAPA